MTADTSRRTFRLSLADAVEFAHASRDLNPLHIDQAFARRTSFGGVVVHGALVVLTALAAVPADWLVRLVSLSADFVAPIRPDVRYDVHVPTRLAPDSVRIQVSSLGTPAAVVRLVSGRASRLVQRLPELPSDPNDPNDPNDEIIRVWRMDDLRQAGEWSVPYRPDQARLRALADRLGADSLPDSLLLWLARASWVAGIQVPGRDGLLAGMTLSPAADGTAVRATPPVAGGMAERTTRIAVISADTRTGSIRVRAGFSGPEGAADAELRTFVRHPVPAPTRASVAAELRPGSGLAGRHVLISGASRGFGAALAGALSTQGATVWALYARSDDAADALRREFGSGQLRPVRCDVADLAQVSAASARIAAEGVSLDGIVLTATPPLHAVGTAPHAVGTVLDHVHRSLEMALRPLAGFLPHIRPNGWLVATSSSAVTAPPDGWGHYAAAKAALEAYASYHGRRHGLRTLLLRAPKMHTELVNGPTGRLGAAPPERVAAAVVRWITAPPESCQDVTLLEPDAIPAAPTCE